MTRTRSNKFLPYIEARQFVQKHKVQSRSKYWVWHKKNKVGFLPKHPHRHYREWISWNDFLGNTNSFEEMTRHKKVYRPFWEAVRWVQKVAKSNHIKTMDQWVEYYENGDVPKDIPKRPDQYYKEFVGKGWGVWLGTSIKGLIMSEKENIAVMGLCYVPKMPKNMIAIVVAHDGIEQLRTQLIELQYQIFKLYKYEREIREDVDKVIKMCSSEQSGFYLVPNVHELTFEIGMLLEEIPLR